MKKNSFEKELERKNQVAEDYGKKVDKLKKEVDSIRTEIIKKEQYYKISGLTTEYNKIEILYNFTKDIKKYIWKDSIKTYLEKVAKGMGEVVKEAIVYTGGSLVKNTIKSILHIS